MLLASPAGPQSGRKRAWLAVAIIANVGVLLLPTPAGLSASGQVATGLLVLVVISWISECVSPAASADMEGLLGVTETCVSLPHILGGQDAAHPLMPAMDEAETGALRHPAQLLHQAIHAALVEAAGLGVVRNSVGLAAWRARGRTGHRRQMKRRRCRRAAGIPFPACRPLRA